MSEVKLAQCICGGTPHIFDKDFRYKDGQLTETIWKKILEITCQGCYKIRVRGKTREAVIDLWNKEVIVVRKKQDAKDKMLYDLEHGSTVEQAFAQILRDVSSIKDQLTSS